MSQAFVLLSSCHKMVLDPVYRQIFVLGRYLERGLREVQSATVLQEIRGLRETPLEQCRRDLRLPLASHHMCVWSKRAQACGGDSGGPVTEELSGGVWILAGVVSFARSSICGANSPLVVTRVGEPGVLAWVKDEVGRDLPKYLK